MGRPICSQVARAMQDSVSPPRLHTHAHHVNRYLAFKTHCSIPSDAQALRSDQQPATSLKCVDSSGWLGHHKQRPDGGCMKAHSNIHVIHDSWLSCRGPLERHPRARTPGLLGCLAQQEQHLRALQRDARIPAAVGAHMVGRRRHEFNPPAGAIRTACRDLKASGWDAAAGKHSRLRTQWLWHSRRIEAVAPRFWRVTAVSAGPLQLLRGSQRITG